MADAGGFQQALERISERLAKSRSLRSGDIRFTLTGSDAGSYLVECRDGQVNVIRSPTAGLDRSPLIEVIGDGARVRAVLAGEKDARMQFMAGAFRVRGDLRYLSAVAVELGLLDRPL
jgi:hypothetical protein